MINANGLRIYLANIWNDIFLLFWESYISANIHVYINWIKHKPKHVDTWFTILIQGTWTHL